MVRVLFLHLEVGYHRLELGSVLSSLLEVVFESHLTVEEQEGTSVQALFVGVLGPY